MKKSFLLSSIVIFMILGSIADSYGSTFSARIERDRVHVKISSTLTQNMTSLFERKIVVSGDSLTNITKLFEKQIKARSPNAYVKDLSVYCTFTNSTVEVAVQFDVLGVVSRHEEVITANLTWRGLNVPDDLSAENVSYNLVGKAYLLKAVAYYENMTETRFYENRTLSATIYRAKDIIGNITMLQLKALATPLSKWQTIYNIARAETSYKLKLGRTVDLAAKRELNVSVTEFGVWMDLTGEISVSGYAKVKGDAIVSEAGIGNSQVLILASVVIPLGIAVTAHMVEKRARIKAEGRRR